jgi:Tfp pilus assembly PilM family ATPase/Tfp pilus assembly protein PilN
VMIGAKQQDVVGVEFGAGTLRICVIRDVASKKEVVALADKDAQNLKDEDIVLFIRKVISGSGVKNPQVACVVPSHLAITKNIELPSQNPTEIQDIINLQASRHTPYGREEIAIDHITIGITSKSYTKVLLVIVNRDVVRKNFEILKKCFLEPDKISFSSEVLGSVFTKCFSLDKENAPTSIVHVDTAFTVCTIVFRDKVIFVRSIPLGIQHLTVEKERQQEKFIEELKQSLELYKNENIASTCGRILITGATEEIQELAALVNDATKIPTENVNYSDCFSFTESAKQIVQNSKLSSFAGALSAACAFSDIKINLVPEEAKIKRALQERSKDLLKTGMLALGIFIVACSFLFSKIYIKSEYLKQLTAKSEILHKDSEVIARDFDRIKFIRNHLARRGQSIEALGEFYKLIPRKVKVSEIRFEKQKSFSCKGTAYSMTDIFSFVEDLNKSDIFKEAKTRYTSQRREDDKDVADFEIVATFTNEK